MLLLNQGCIFKCIFFIFRFAYGIGWKRGIQQWVSGNEKILHDAAFNPKIFVDDKLISKRAKTLFCFGGDRSAKTYNHSCKRFRSMITLFYSVEFIAIQRNLGTTTSRKSYSKICLTVWSEYTYWLTYIIHHCWFFCDLFCSDYFRF